MTVRRITIELTNACQLRCPMCPRHHTRMAVGFMPAVWFEKILEDLPANATVFPFWRGEPTLHPQFTTLMRAARDAVTQVRGRLVVGTNGLITSYPTMWGLLCAHTVTVSVHNRESYRGLVNILEARDFHNPQMRVTASMVEGEKTGVHPDSLRIADEVRLYREHTLQGKWGQIRGYRKPKVQDFCRRLETDLVIGWDGRVSRCCYVWQPILGLSAYRLYLDQILASDQYRRILQNYPDKACRDCSQWMGDGRTL